MVTPRDKKRTGLFKFVQRIPPRWYKLIRGGVWHIGALSCHNVMCARKKGWQVKILSVFHAKEEVAGNNNEGVGNDKTPQTNGMQAQLWRDVEV